MTRNNIGRGCTSSKVKRGSQEETKTLPKEEKHKEREEKKINGERDCNHT